MTKTEIRKALLTVEKLRNEGFAVIIWYPEELNYLEDNYVSVEHLEEVCVEAGWEYIESNKID